MRAARGVEGLGRQRRAAKNQVAGLLRDHDDCRVCIAADDGRKHGRVCHTQVVETDDSQFRVHHSAGIVAHAAGADGMMDRVGLCADISGKFCVALSCASGRGFLGSVLREGRRREDLSGQAHAANQRRQILRRGEQIRIDQRRFEWVWDSPE